MKFYIVGTQIFFFIAEVILYGTVTVFRLLSNQMIKTRYTNTKCSVLLGTYRGQTDGTIIVII